MTRTVGFRRTITPCCQRQYLETAFASINFTASEYWTDGHREASLAPTDGGVRRCACGQHYTTADATYLPGLVQEEGSVPRGQRVSDLDLASALATRSYTANAEIALRRRLWRAGNEPYRKAYRAIKRVQKNAFPSYELSVVARDNLIRLSEMLRDDSVGNAIELCEIYRALGDSVKADGALAQHSDDETEVRMASLMRQLLKLCVSGPVRYQL